MDSKRKRRYVHTSLVVAVNLIGLVFIAYLIFWGPTGLTGYATFSTESQSDFDLGEYNQTFYNDSGEFIQLNLTYNSGTYTSKVFDANRTSLWRNISWGEDVNTSVNNLTLQVRSCENSNCNDSEFSGAYSESELENLSLTNERYFQYKFDFSTEDLSSSPLLYNVTIGYEEILEPGISLSSPESDSTSDFDNVTLSYVVSSLTNISNCSLFWGGSLDTVDDSITVVSTQSFSKNSLENGTYNWSINCTDLYDQTNNSDIYYLTVAYTEVPEDDDDDDDSSSSTTTSSTPSSSSRSSRPSSSDSEENATVNGTSNFNKTNTTNLVGEDDGWVGSLLTGFSTFTGNVVKFTSEDIIGFFKDKWATILVVGLILVVFVFLSFWFGLKRGVKGRTSNTKKDKKRGSDTPNKKELRETFRRK